MTAATRACASPRGEATGAAGDLHSTTEAGGPVGRCRQDLAVEDDGELVAAVLLGVLIEETGAGVLEAQIDDELAGHVISDDGGAVDLDTREERLHVRHALGQRALPDRALQLRRHGHEPQLPRRTETGREVRRGREIGRAGLELHIDDPGVMIGDCVACDLHGTEPVIEDGRRGFEGLVGCIGGCSIAEAVALDRRCGGHGGAERDDRRQGGDGGEDGMAMHRDIVGAF